MAVQIPAQAIADSKAAGDLWQVVLAIAGPESTWRADAIGDNGTSYGYLQMHTPGGLGDGYSKAQLLDGPTNMRLGAAYIRSRLASGATLYQALSPWSTRDAAWALYQRIQAEGINGVGTATTAASGGLMLAVGIIALLWLVS